ncbi:MAG: transglutaminase domain-containing protein [Exilispira sp.]
MKKGIKLFKLYLTFFIKRNKILLFLSLICSIISSVLLYFITKIPFFLFVFFPTLILLSFNSKLFKNFTTLSKILILIFSSILLLYIFSILASFILQKGIFLSLVIFFYSILFNLFSILLYFIFKFILKNEYLYLSFALLLSFITSILADSVIVSLIVFSFSIFVFFIAYYILSTNTGLRFNTKTIFFILLVIIAIISFFLVQISSNNKEGNLLTERLFKFDFNDQVNLKSDYKFKGTLLFIAKLDRSKLLKAVSYPEFSREKGFYFKDRDLPFPLELIDKIWEDHSYIKGERVDENIMVYNLNLKEGIVFGPNEPYKIIPYMKIQTSKFSSIFSEYSRSLVISNLDDISFSIDNLSKQDYLRYTFTDKKDPYIEEFIEKYKDYYQSKKDFIIFFYNYFKKNYFYSISTSQKEGYEGILSFLFKTKKGYCTHFASTYALLLRYYGIPARVVGGFKAIEDNKILDYYRFYDFNAHSWVEIYTDEYGWIAVDPTSDRVDEDEMLPFEKPLDQDESSLLEEILKIENDLVPARSKLEDISNKDKKDQKIPFENFIFIISILIILLLLFILKDYITIFISLIFPEFITKSLIIYIKRIAKLLKKDFITAEQLKDLKIYLDPVHTHKHFDDFALIYNNIMFAQSFKIKSFINKNYSKLAYESYLKIVKDIKRINKINDKEIID